MTTPDPENRYSAIQKHPCVHLQMGIRLTMFQHNVET